MNSHEFCYWLQGYFELSGNNDALTRKQAECVIRHANLVKAVDKTRTSNFVSWMKGVLQAVKMIDSAEHKFEDFSASITELIRVELSECFKHEIDNKYGVNGLNQIHSNFPLNPNNDLIRC